MSKLVVNTETGEEVTRELTKAEKDQQKIDAVLVAEQEAASLLKAQQRQAVIEKLGLTTDEVKLLLG
jgi:hypothetical protein